MKMDEGTCPIWGTLARVIETDGGIVYDSPRAGGKYQITNSVKESIRKNFKEDDDKVKLTDWLIEERQAGKILPKINKKILKRVKDRQEKEPSERINSLILYLATNDKPFLFTDFNFIGAPQGEITSVETTADLMAYSSSTKPKEVRDFLEDFKKDGYLKVIEDPPLQYYAITLEGKKYAEKIRKEKNQKSVSWIAPIANCLKESGKPIFQGVMAQIIFAILGILAGLLGASWLLKP